MLKKFVTGFLPIGLAIVLMLLGSCESDKVKNIPDVSEIEAKVEIIHFNQLLLQLDTNDVQNGLAALEQEHPDFTRIYLDNVLNIRKDWMPEEKYIDAIRGFLTFPSVRKLADTVNTVYNDFSVLQDEFDQAFRFYKYYFPQRELPTIYTYLSEYTIGAFVADPNIIGVGLDFYLGEDYPLYDPSFFPQYIRRTMNKEHLVFRSIEALANDLAGEPNGDRLIDLMIHNGKVHYIVDQLLPYTADSIKLGYTAQQVQWVNNNEAAIWAHFIAEDLLYSTDYKNIRKLVDHSPHSPGMPQEAPGRTANWLGWQIVKAYMDRRPNASLTDLIDEKDAQKLMEISKYKPKK
jgi:hypothetical protein